MEKARCNTELYSNLREPLNNVKPSNFWGSCQMSGLFYFKITKYYTKYRIFKSLFNFIRVSFEKFF